MSDERLIDRLCEEFLARHRAGERPAITEYIQAHPELANEIRELFATQLLLELAAPESPSPSQLPDQLGEYRILR